MTDTGVSTGDPIRVLIVDDSSMMRQILRRTLSAASDLLVVGEAADGAQAVEEAVRTTPDVILLDLEMPRVGGLEALPRLRARSPARVVVVSSRVQPGSDIRLEARAGGADAVLPKPGGALSLDLGPIGTAIIAAIRRVAAHRTA